MRRLAAIQWAWSRKRRNKLMHTTHGNPLFGTQPEMNASPGLLPGGGVQNSPAPNRMHADPTSVQNQQSFSNPDSSYPRRHSAMSVPHVSPMSIRSQIQGKGGILRTTPPSHGSDPAHLSLESALGLTSHLSETVPGNSTASEAHGLAKASAYQQTFVHFPSRNLFPSRNINIQATSAAQGRAQVAQFPIRNTYTSATSAAQGCAQEADINLGLSPYSKDTTGLSMTSEAHGLADVVDPVDSKTSDSHLNPARAKSSVSSCKYTDFRLNESGGGVTSAAHGSAQVAPTPGRSTTRKSGIQNRIVSRASPNFVAPKFNSANKAASDKRGNTSKTKRSSGAHGTAHDPSDFTDVSDPDFATENFEYTEDEDEEPYVPGIREEPLGDEARRTYSCQILAGVPRLPPKDIRNPDDPDDSLPFTELLKKRQQEGEQRIAQRVAEDAEFRRRRGLKPLPEMSQQYNLNMPVVDSDDDIPPKFSHPKLKKRGMG